MEFPEGTVLIEVRGIYDGWSVAELPSGELVNRWQQDSRRHVPTQQWIDRKEQETVDDEMLSNRVQSSNKDR